MNVRDQVVRFLRTHPSINAVNFQFRGYKIWPAPYRTDVANAVASGDIKLGTAVDDGAAATYRMDQDRLEISPTTNFASLRHQGYVLHECTHAVLDMRSVGEHSGFDDEAVAYLAQAFFLTRTLGDAGATPDLPVPLYNDDEDGVGIYREAKRIAAKAMRTGAYYIEEQDAVSLVLQIANQPIYQKQPRYLSNRFKRNAWRSFLRSI